MIHARILKTFLARPDSGAFTLDLAFEARAGITALFGPSGAGKTLTLEGIAGFVKPDAGRIVLEERVLFDHEGRVWVPPQRRECGYVFQNYALFPHMTLRQNLEFALRRDDRGTGDERVSRMLEQFRLSDMAGRKPHEVSGGQRQRCSIARALIGRPRLLLLDEPAQGLDTSLRKELYEVLRQVRREFGTPVLLVTHDLEECFELAEEMFVIEDGRIIQRGTPAAVLEAPASLAVVRLLGQFRIVEAEVVKVEERIHFRVGRHVIPGLPCPGVSPGGRVEVYWNPARLRAVPASAGAAPDSVAAKLIGVHEGPKLVRLDFGDALEVVVTHADFERNRDNQNWLIEFPKGSAGVF